MFDLRYHVASLAAVFIALVIGILVGVAISGHGLLSEGERRNLQAQIDARERELEVARVRAREQDALEEYERQTYAAVMDGRLADRSVAVVFVGSVEGDLAAGIRTTLDDANATTARLRALKVPIRTGELLAAAADVAESPRTVEELGRGLADELVEGGETALWNAVGPLLVEEREGGGEQEVDAVVVARTAEAQRGQTSRFLAAFYAGLAGGGIAVVGAETVDAEPTAVPTYRRHGFSTVDHVDTAAGRVALAVLLEGDARGAFGVKDGVDGAIPAVEPVRALSG